LQSGVRAIEGRLTVNLAIFHPVYRQGEAASPVPERPKEYDCLLRARLSTLRDTPITKFFRSRIAKPSGLLGWWLITPADYWWQLSDDEAKVQDELKRIEVLLVDRGLDWLALNCDEAGLKEAYENITCRKAQS